MGMERGYFPNWERNRDWKKEKGKKKGREGREKSS